MTKKKVVKKKVAAKHKPSTKRTLEEVLSSLQDLAKNELSDTELQARSGVEPDQPEKLEPDPDFPGITSESVEPIQMDMPAPNTELASGQTGDIFDGLELLPDEQISNASNDEQTEESVPEDPEQTETGEEEIRWEDIPVLENVADDPRDGGGRATQDAKAEDPLNTEVFEAPDPRLARKIAIQVAARLNIEMHKQGLDGLDIATINRLRALLVKELAKAATKSENDET
jgi:hypothetical protein